MKSYCSPKLNSQGCQPQLAHNGLEPSLTGGALIVFATDVLEKQNGLFFWGLSNQSIPFFGGTLCVTAPLTRTPVQPSGGCSAGPQACGFGLACKGSYWFALSSSYLSSQGLGAGTTMYCQAWARDPADPFTVSLTNALSIPLYP